MNSGLPGVFRSNPVFEIPAPSESELASTQRYRQLIRFWRARRAFSKSSTILSSESPHRHQEEFIHRRPVIGPPMLPIPIV
jgi:hypothetical protein